jgi:hypothetical protein
MTGPRPVQRVSDVLIRISCRRLPADERVERCREWSAEVLAILADESIKLPIRRGLRALRYSAGVSRTARYLRRTTASSNSASRHSGWRDGALPVRPATLGPRLVIGVIVWLVMVVAAISAVRADPQRPLLSLAIILALAAAFDAFCLIDIARAKQVRYLPKWAWALICLGQAPAGGIVYLCVGRVDRAPSAPGNSAGRP